MREYAGTYAPDPGKESQAIIQDIEKALGLDPTAKPEWGYGRPKEQIFPEEAPTIKQRERAASCVEHLRTFVLTSTMMGHPVSPEEVIHFCQDWHGQAKQDWERGWRGKKPFPEFNITNVLGATKRQALWFEELKHFEETDLYDKQLREYYTIQNLLEQGLKANSDASLGVLLFVKPNPAIAV